MGNRTQAKTLRQSLRDKGKEETVEAQASTKTEEMMRDTVRKLEHAIDELAGQLKDTKALLDDSENALREAEDGASNSEALILSKQTEIDTLKAEAQEEVGALNKEIATLKAQLTKARKAK